MGVNNTRQDEKGRNRVALPVSRRKFLLSTTAASLGVSATAQMVGADAGDDDEAGDGEETQEFVAVPGGPWLTHTQRRNLDRFLSYEQLEQRVEQLAQTSNVTLNRFGKSNQGRDLFHLTVGQGPSDVMIVTQQHGHEPTGTESVLRLLQKLRDTGQGNTNDGNGNDTPWNLILDELTIHVVPRVNPDGGEQDVFTRYTVDEQAPIRNAGDGIYTSWSQSGVGWDTNRYHWAEWEDSDLYQNRPEKYPENPVPESRALNSLIKDIDPLWLADMHNQLTYVQDGKMIGNSFLWPLHPDTPDDARILGKQLCRLAYDTVNSFGDATASRFPGGGTLGTARNTWGVEGVASILIEARGSGADMVGQKGSGRLIRREVALLEKLLEQTATGEVHDIDPALADEMRERGPRLFRDLPRGKIAVGDEVDALVNSARLEWDILNDPVACSVDGAFLDRLPTDVGGTLVIEPEITGLARPYYIARTHDEASARVVRMGRNARTRFYAESDEEVGTRLKSTLEVDPEWTPAETRLGQSGWDLTAEDCSIDAKFAENISLSVGETILIENEETGVREEFNVARTHSGLFRYDGQPQLRMNFAGRTRFYDGSTPSEFVCRFKSVE